MKKYIYVLLVPLLGIFMSCSNGFYEIISRTTSDPFDDAPAVNSFDAINKITLQWQQDDGADTYILMRAVNDTTLTYKATSSCYYYKFDDKTYMIDYDWYKVKLPAMKKATIEIEDTVNGYFEYILPGYTSPCVLNNKEYFYITNNDYTEQMVYFAIRANPDEFVTADTPGGDIRSYKLELTTISAQ